MSKFHGIPRRPDFIGTPRDDILKKVIGYLLYLFVFLLPWQTRWIIYNPLISGNVWEYGRISIYAFDIIFIVLSILYLVLCIRQRKFCLTKFSLIFIPLFLYSFITIIWADYKILSLYWSLRILQGILLIWILSKTELFDRVKLAWSFVAGVSLSAALGIYQFLTQSAFDYKWLGLAYHSAQILGDSVIEFADQRWLRAYGSFPHPNILAGFCVLAVILSIWLLNKTQDKKKILFYYFITLLLTTALFFTFSRAAWIVFLVLCILYLVLCIKKKLKIRNWKLLFFLLFVVSCLLLVIYWPLVKTRFYSNERLEINSNIERVEGTQQSFEIIKDNLWLGTGLGNYTVELQKLYPNENAWDYQPVHNVYLLMLSEIGLIGVLIIIILLYRIISCIKYYVLSNKIYVFMFLCFYVFMFLWDHFWWTLPSGMLIMFLSLGVFVTQAFRPDKKQG